MIVSLLGCCMSNLVIIILAITLIVLVLTKPSNET